MAMSESAVSKQTVMIVVIVVALGVSLVMLMRSGGSRSTTGNDGYFYDLTTGELFADTKSQVPPIDAPGGAGKGVRAVVLSCGSCGENDRRIGYLEMLTDAARAGIKAMQDPATITPQAGQDIEAGTLVALPPDKPGDEPKWVVKTSPAGQRIVHVEQALCSPQLTQHCYP
jgi:hypothetical protein